VANSIFRRCSLNAPSPFLERSLSFQVNLVLDDAVEYTPDPNNKDKFIESKLNTEILLNGNQIAVLVPGGKGPSKESIIVS